MADLWKFKEDAEADYRSVESQRDKLIEIMESEFRLTDKLLKMEALLYRQVEKIRYAVTREYKNEMILDLIMQKGKFQDLIKALSESFQTHLVNYINSNGVYSSEFGLDWPLTEREHKILNDNEEHLTGILDTSELLHKLYSKQVINMKQRNFISSRTSDQARNEALLGMIRRLSQASYLILIQCLKDSYQGHIANILENGGAGLSDNMNELENHLQKTRKFLEEIIDSDFGLIDKLRTKSILNAREIEAIKAKYTFIRRNSLLLDIISNKKKIPELCEVLKDTGQQHIVNYLQAHGERSQQFGENWPLTDKETSIIDGNYDVLTDILDTLELTCLLYSKGVINRRHRDFISSKSTPADKNKALLEILKRCSLRSYKQTIKCLRESNQNYLADILETGGAGLSDNMNELENHLQMTRNFLEEIIDSDFGLIDKLRTKSILNAREIEDIEVKDTFIRRNSLLLDIISNKKKIPELCEVLKDTGQQHIVNYLQAHGERSTQFGENWPLTDKETSIIDGNFDVLTDILDSSELTGILCEKQVINKRHRNFISSKSTPEDKNEALLEILKRCSLRSYKQTIECLRESKQYHIADILETGGEFRF